MGITSYHEEKKRKRQYELNRRSNIKRQYLKIRKQEDTGDSSKNLNHSAQSDSDSAHGPTSKSIKHGRLSSRANPFQKAQDNIEQEKAEKEAERLERQRKREEEQKKKDEYLRKRNETRKNLSKKTSKGQPNMNNVVTHLLDKLMAEQKR